MAHKIYDNFYLSNEVEDQFNSHLDLQQFCTVDNSLVGTAGMKRKINTSFMTMEQALSEKVSLSLVRGCSPTFGNIMHSMVATKGTFF